MNALGTILFIILPVFAAGITFIIILKFKILDFLNYPLDLRLYFRGKRVFGENKIIRGPLVMSFFTSFYGWLINLSLGNPFNLSNKYVLINFFLIGLLFSLGELPNSFLKRQLDIPPGELSKKKNKRILFKLVDTFDSLFFCGLGYIIIFRFPVFSVFISILIGGILHLFTDKLMVKISLKKNA
jgi:hypothetical protein